MLYDIFIILCGFKQVFGKNYWRCVKYCYKCVVFLVHFAFCGTPAMAVIACADKIIVRYAQFFLQIGICCVTCDSGQCIRHVFDMKA